MKKIIVVGISVLVLAVAWYQWSLRPVDSSSQDRQAVTIESGMSVQDIAVLLQEKGIIRSPLAFALYTKFHGQESSLQAGKFVLRPSASVAEIITMLQDGKAEEMLITIPEGFTVRQIDALLAEKGVIQPGDIISCAQTCDFSSFEFLPEELEGIAINEAPGGRVEGYLFPDTYYVEVDEFVPKFFIERLLTTFRKRILTPFAEDIASSERTLHEIMTMASLIEEETRTDEERPVISGILWKRYDAGLGLGVDATVRYILEKPTAEISVNDLNTNSPYNTRKFKGLPPGPIANPSLESIRAALLPQESPYWYYLHGNDGQVHYAETNEEHNINRYQYLRN
ncbi:MAG: endolytic transglycosylase MltG [Candidatus Peribacteraceae bacterium]